MSVSFREAVEARKKQDLGEFAHFPKMKIVIDSMPEEDRAQVIVALRGTVDGEHISARELSRILGDMGYEISSSSINNYRSELNLKGQHVGTD